MKCVITGEDTNTLTKGIPVSRNGRDLITDYLQRFADSEISKLGFIMTRKMAMDDLFQGRDIVKEFEASKAEKEAESLTEAELEEVLDD